MGPKSPGPPLLPSRERSEHRTHGSAQTSQVKGCLCSPLTLAELVSLTLKQRWQVSCEVSMTSMSRVRTQPAMSARHSHRLFSHVISVTLLRVQRGSPCEAIHTVFLLSLACHLSLQRGAGCCWAESSWNFLGFLTPTLRTEVISHPSPSLKLLLLLFQHHFCTLGLLFTFPAHSSIHLPPQSYSPDIQVLPPLMLRSVSPVPLDIPAECILLNPRFKTGHIPLVVSGCCPVSRDQAQLF